MELEKTLLSPAPETVADMLEAGLLAGLCDGAGAARVDFVCLQSAPKKRRERFGALTALLDAVIAAVVMVLQWMM